MEPKEFYLLIIYLSIIKVKYTENESFSYEAANTKNILT
jgi:hypothetical protein